MKQNKTSNDHQTPPQRQPRRKPSSYMRHLDRPAPRLHKVVIELDAYAAGNLHRLHGRIDRFSFGPEDNALVFRATVPFHDLLKIASWVYSMESHVSVRSPWFFKEAAKFKIPAPSLPGLHFFPA